MNGVIKRALEKGDLIPKAFTYALIKMGYSNWAIKDLEIRNKMYNKIERKYADILENTSPEKKDRKNSNVVWSCWLQGIDAAPEIVKRCMHTQKNWMRDWKYIVIDRNNYHSYIDIPNYIIEKWESGKISNAHFSDLIRLELLIKYGGIWMDSTIFLSDRIPDYIKNSDLFLYTNDNSFDTRRNLENWFIKAKSNSQFLTYIRDVLYEYWKRENKCQEYFIWNLFAYYAAKKYPDELREMPCIPHNVCYLLNRSLESEYSFERMRTIYSITPIHKLSYKFDINKMGKDSIYARLIGENDVDKDRQ